MKVPYKKTKKGVLTVAHNHQRELSVRRGHPSPNYSLQQFHDQFLDCPRFDVLYRAWVDSGYNRDQKPSFDRVDCLKPYTLDNLQLMTWSENNAKGREESIKTRSTHVAMFNLNGELLKSFDSIQAAVEFSKCDPSTIIRACQGKTDKARKYRWEYIGKMQRRPSNELR